MPAWVLAHKEPKTEIKCIEGTYYKYQVSYLYNAQKKRTDKKSGKLLGKITQEQGFVRSDKDKIRNQQDKVPHVDTKNFGIYHLFTTLLKDEITLLGDFFDKEQLEVFLSFSLIRWAYQSTIKKAVAYHHSDFCSEEWRKDTFSDKKITAALKYMGQNRNLLIAWMSKLLEKADIKDGKFVMMDSTHVFSHSQHINVNALSYNPAHIFDKQIRG